jgi:transposase
LWCKTDYHGLSSKPARALAQAAANAPRLGLRIIAQELERFQAHVVRHPTTLQLIGLTILLFGFWLPQSSWKERRQRTRRRGQSSVRGCGPLAVRTGAPWRDLPPAFGKWNSVFIRFNRWSHKGVWESLFKVLADDPNFEHVMIDATIVRAHQHAAGAKGEFKMKPSVVRVADPHRR